MTYQPAVVVDKPRALADYLARWRAIPELDRQRIVRDQHELRVQLWRTR